MSGLRILASLTFICAHLNAAGSLKELVRALGGPGSAAMIQTDLAQYGDRAIDELILGLKPLQRRGAIAPDDLEAMKFVYRIRALQYLTSVRFCAPTSYRFGNSKTERLRKELLTSTECSNGGFLAFGCWRSRSVVFLAPMDAQTMVVEQWRAWASSPARRLKQAQDLNDWWD